MLKKLLNLTYGLLVTTSLCAVSQAAVVFTDDFNLANYPAGGTQQEFYNYGWANLTGSGGVQVHTDAANKQGPDNGSLWGNPIALERYDTNVLQCGDIIAINANCWRFEGYTYVREIVIWDGVNEASRQVVASVTDGRAANNYATWWFPPVVSPLSTLTYNATPADVGKKVIFRYGHQSNWGITADVTFSITPVTAPIIVTQPKSLVRTEGEAAVLSVNALGCPMSYQWYKDGQVVSGATSKDLTLSPVTLGQMGTYYCHLTLGTNTVNTETVSLIVERKASIGASISFGINFGDEAPYNPTVTAPAYGLHPSRWLDTPPGNEGAPVTQTGLTYPVGAGQLTLDYSANNTYSNPGDPATLLPGNAQVNYGYLDDGGSGYAVTLTGLISSLHYSSYVVRTIAASDNATNFNTVTVTDPSTAISQTLTYGPTVPASASGGRAAVSSVSTALTSDSITLTSMRDGSTLTRGCLAGLIITDRPVISTQPVAPAGNVFQGEAISLNAAAFGVPPLTYQWLKDGTNIPSATTASFAKSAAATTDSGVYQLVVSNAYGVASSISATVTVVSFIQPTVVQQPSPTTAYVGHSAIFTVVGYGGQLSYQWKKDGNNIDGATAPTLLIQNVTLASQGGYSCYISNPAGNTTSDSALLTVAPVPTTGYLGAVLTDNPVTLWRLNERSGGIAYDMWGTNHAVFSGSYTQGVAGLTADGDKAAYFKPSSKAMAPFSTGLNNPAGPFSVEFWAKPTAAGQECIISSQKRDSGRAGFTIFMNNGGSGFSALLGNSASGTLFLNGGTTVQANTLYHVVLTYDGTTAKLYLNGKLDASAALAFPGGFDPNPDAPFQLGARNSGDGFPYDGVLDDVAVYNFALTSAQVQKHTLAVVPLTVGITKVDSIVRNDKPAVPVNGQNFGATWLASDIGRSGVMHFDATNENQIAVNSYPELNSAYGTICFWIRMSEFAGTGSESSMIFDRRSTGGSGSGTIIAINDGQNNPPGTIFFQANPSGANPFSSSRGVNDGAWHHVAVTYGQAAGELVSIYMDGTYDNGGYNALAWSWPDLNILLGKSRDGYWKKLHGNLDDVRIYNRILTDTEITQVMGGAAVDNAAMVMRLNFDAAPSAGYRLSTSPLEGTVQSTTALGTGFAPLGTSPYLFIPGGPTQFFRAVATP